METRQDLRLSVSCPIQYSGAGVQGQGTLLNISTGGYAVSVSEHIPHGTQVSLKVCLPDGREPYEIEVQAIWGEKGGVVGMKHLTLPEKEGQRLRRFILSLAQKEDLVYFHQS